MKSLQHMAILATITLIASCGGSGGGSDPVVEPTPVSPAAVAGQVAGIANAVISVTDSNGVNIAITDGETTDANGAFSASFSTAAIEAGFTGPLRVSVDASGASTVCYWDVDGDNDCPIGDGTFAAFGSAYTLPAGFSLSGLGPDAPIGVASVTINVNALTEIAAQLAARESGAFLSAADVALGASQLLALVQTLTGIDVSGIGSLHTYNLSNLTDISSTTLDDAGLALAIFNASLIGQIDVNNPDLNSLLAVINNITAGIVVDGADIQASGSLLARMAWAMSTGAIAAQAQLELAGLDSAIAASISTTASSNATLFALAGDSTVTIAPPPVPGSGEAVASTKVFVTNLSNMIDTILVTTGAQGTADTSEVGATEVFAAELDAIARMSSWHATQAFKQLADALATAESTLEPGASVTWPGPVLSGTVTLSDDGNTLNIADVVSVYTGEDGNAVSIAITTGARTEDGMSGSLWASGVTMETWVEGAAIQTFTGNITTTFEQQIVCVTAPCNDDIGLSAATFDGWIAVTSIADTSFAVDVSLWGITGTTSDNGSSQDINGHYSASLSFSNPDTLNVGIMGDIHGLSHSFSISVGTDTVWGSATRDGDIDTDVLTDLTTTLTLTLDIPNSTLQNGVFWVGQEQTGTLDDSGTVTYSDGTVQSLPAAIF